jgi:hypothetical protein
LGNPRLSFRVGRRLGRHLFPGVDGSGQIAGLLERPRQPLPDLDLCPIRLGEPSQMGNAVDRPLVRQQLGQALVRFGDGRINLAGRAPRIYGALGVADAFAGPRRAMPALGQAVMFRHGAQVRDGFGQPSRGREQVGQAVVRLEDARVDLQGRPPGIDRPLGVGDRIIGPRQAVPGLGGSVPLGRRPQIRDRLEPTAAGREQRAETLLHLQVMGNLRLHLGPDIDGFVEFAGRLQGPRQTLERLHLALVALRGDP